MYSHCPSPSACPTCQDRTALPVSLSAIKCLNCPPLPPHPTPPPFRRARLADLQARAEAAEAAKIELSLKVRCLASSPASTWWLKGQPLIDPTGASIDRVCFKEAGRCAHVHPLMLKVHLSVPPVCPLQVAELAAAAAEQQADIDAAPSGRRGGGGSADSGSEATGGGDGEGGSLLQRAEGAELAAAAAGRRAAAAEAEVDKLKVGLLLYFCALRFGCSSARPTCTSSWR